MIKHVLLSGLFHETNTMIGEVTRLEDFDAKLGRELFEAEGDSSPLAGVLEVAREKDWELLPTVDLRAAPSGTVDDEVLDFFWSEFQEAFQSHYDKEIHGVYFILHGAMVSQSIRDVEGEMLRRIRSLPGLSNVPVCGVLDLHANYTLAMALFSSGLISYRANPHTDAKESAKDGARLLDRLMKEGGHPITVWEHPPIMWPPSGTGTEAPPMQDLELQARDIEENEPGILAVNVLAGFPFSDIPEAGLSFSAVTVGDPEQAKNRLRELSGIAWSMREAGLPNGIPLDEAIQKLKNQDRGPVLLVEPSDNIGGGAPGEGTRILKAFLENDVRNSGVIINDPAAVRALKTYTLGERVQISLGGKTKSVGMESLTLEDAEVVSRSDGQFTLEDPNSHLAARFGSQANMGPCIVLRCKGVYVLVTSRKMSPFDLGQWRSQGVDPENLFAIGIKAAVGHKRAYDPIAAASYVVDVPGPTAENLTRLPFQNVARPIYPLDVVHESNLS